MENEVKNEVETVEEKNVEVENETVEETKKVETKEITETPKEEVSTKRKGHGPLYWIIVIVGVALIVYLSIGIGEKLGRYVELESGSGNKTTTKEEVDSNDNSDTNTGTEVSNSNVTPETSNENKDNNELQIVSVRTYRFFGYTEDIGPDMFTTLKLYSNGEYELYVNNCHGVTKFNGKYTETDKDITLTGEKNMTFTKKDNGNSLSFDATKLAACNASNGNFALESNILGIKTTEDTQVKTYRFFGYTEDIGPDMFTTLKLYSNGEYELYVNNCHGVTKFNGKYTETDKDITLTGEKNMTFTKKDNGDSLSFDATKLAACNASNGNFALENSILNK